MKLLLAKWRKGKLEEQENLRKELGIGEETGEKSTLENYNPRR